MRIEDIAALLLKTTGAPVEIERYGFSRLVVKLEVQSIRLYQLMAMIDTCEGNGNCTINIADGKFSIEIPLRRGAKLGNTRKERKEINRNALASRPIRSRAYYADANPHKEVVVDDDENWLEKRLEEFSKEIEECKISPSLEDLSEITEGLT